MVEWTVIIAAGAAICSLVFGVASWRRGTKQDAGQDAGQSATLLARLDAISDGVTEIKSDMKGFRGDLSELRERTAKVEASAAQAHKRIDRVEKEGRRYDDEGCA